MAGLTMSFGREFDYGVDGTFHPVVQRGTRRTESGIPLDFQLKASINWSVSDDCIVYDMEADAYNDIVTRTSAETTKILILLCLPNVEADWHVTSHEGTTLKNCCYWYLPDGDSTANTSRKRVFIPLDNLLTPTTLVGLMEEERARRHGQV